MKLAYALFSVLAAVGIVAQTADPQINTPVGLTQCEPSQLTYSGSHAPFIITVIPGGQPSAAPLETVSTSASGTALTWICDIAAGTSITFAIKDSTGVIAYSAPVTVLAGSDTTCNNAAAGASSAAASTAPASSAGASTAPATSAPPATTVVAATTPPATTPPASSASTSAKVASVISSAASAASASATKKSSGQSLKPGMCLAGVFGLVGAAVLL